MANVKISTINTTQGYQQPVNPNADGVVANGFYPQNGTSNDANAGVERDASGNLVLKDAAAGSKTLSSLIIPTTVSVFTSSGTWTKPTGATMARIILLGGGGGGASGATGANNVNRSGGQGGGAGQLLDMIIPLASVGSTATVTVGAGGLGQTAAADNPGSNGGNTTFGTANTAGYLIARGGTAGGASNGNGKTYSTPYGYAGFTASTLLGTAGARGAGTTGGATTPAHSGGGAGGGGVSAANTGANGGQALPAPQDGLLYLTRGNQASVVLGGAGNGASGNTTQVGLGLSAAIYFGTGGAGGGGNGTAAPGNGGAGGANTGAGGGGGGAGTTPLYGNGGDGGSGWAVVISW